MFRSVPIVLSLVLGGCTLFGINYSAPTDRTLKADLAVVAARQGDYALAYRLDEPLARNGNFEAQWRLSVMHARGLHVSRDIKEAAYWSALSRRGNSPVFDSTWAGIADQLTKEETEAAIERAKAFKPEPLPADYRAWRDRLEAAR